MMKGRRQMQYDLKKYKDGKNRIREGGLLANQDQWVCGSLGHFRLWGHGGGRTLT